MPSKDRRSKRPHIPTPEVNTITLYEKGYHKLPEPSASAEALRKKTYKPDLAERVAEHYMIQCQNSKDFECPYLETCPHEDNDVCEWQRDQARTLIPLIEQETKKPIIKDLETCFELAPEDDSYLRILIEDVMETLKTGKTGKQRADERYQFLKGGKQ